jgi:hypothetical protein
MTDNTETNVPAVVEEKEEARTEQGFAEAYNNAKSRLSGNTQPAPVKEEEKPPVKEEKEEEKEDPAGEEGVEKEEKKPKDKKGPKPDHPTNDLSWIEEIEDEDKKKKIQQLLNERQSAIGRAAYLQSQAARKAPKDKKQGAQEKPFVPPSKPEKWNALVEADPALADTFEARLQAELDARDKYWKEQIEEKLTPLQQAEAQREAQYEQWRESQVQAVFEAHPDVQIVQKSPEFTQWLEGMDKHYPGFIDYVDRVDFAYGDKSSLDKMGVVDLIDLFHYHRNEALNGPAPTDTPVVTGNADKVAQARSERLQQPPIPSGNPGQAVAQRKGELDKQAAFEKAYREAQNRLGIRKPG